MRIMSKKKSPFLSSKNLTLMSGLFLGLMITGESQAAKCSISSTSLDFGAVSPALSTTSTNVMLRCDPQSTIKTNVRVCLTATSWLYNDITRSIYTSLLGIPNLFQSLKYNLFYDPGFTHLIQARDQLTSTGCRDYTITGGKQLTEMIPVYGLFYPGQIGAAGNYRSSTLSLEILYDFERNENYPNGYNASNLRYSDTANMSVFAEYENVCALLSTTDLDFGQIDNLNRDLHTSGQISLQCPSRTTWRVGLNNGKYALNNQRRMFNGKDYINYDLYQNSTLTQRWDSSNNRPQGVGTNGQQSISVYGHVPQQPLKSAGNYSDTVTVTLTY